MPKYPRDGDGLLGFRRNFWVCGLLIGVLLLCGTFLLGMYYGYNQGYRAAQESLEAQQIVKSDTTPTSRRSKPRSQNKKPKFERVITNEDINGTSSSRPSPDGTPQNSSGESMEQSAGNTERGSMEGQDVGTRRRYVSATSENSSGTEDNESSTQTDQTSTSESPRGIVGASTPLFTIQVSSSQNKQRALSKKKQLVERGLEASLTQKTINGEPWYRVRVGKFTTKGKAEVRAQSLKKQGMIQDYWISRLLPDS